MAGTMRSSTTSYFNPRAPCGARQEKGPNPSRENNFNPRAPCGARLTPQRGRRAPKKISIHAPRVGRDLAASELPPSIVLFQSTRPVWGATAIRGARARAEAISIHAPRVGRDKGRGENLVVTLDISIHAPRVGRDCGRHHTDDRAKRFQSTRPVWGATWDQITDMAAAVFQSTRPVWGATTLSLAWRYMRKTFQSTRPVWGATIRPKRGHFFLGISIHAPRVGRDYGE